jgi:hypothetical protein
MERYRLWGDSGPKLATNFIKMGVLEVRSTAWRIAISLCF